MEPYTVDGIKRLELEEKFREGDDEFPSSSEEFMYDLVGVLVHLGEADHGHYYSYIRDRSDPTNSGINLLLLFFFVLENFFWVLSQKKQKL